MGCSSSEWYISSMDLHQNTPLKSCLKGTLNPSELNAIANHAAVRPHVGSGSGSGSGDLGLQKPELSFTFLDWPNV